MIEAKINFLFVVALCGANLGATVALVVLVTRYIRASLALHKTANEALKIICEERRVPKLTARVPKITATYDTSDKAYVMRTIVHFNDNRTQAGLSCGHSTALLQKGDFRIGDLVTCFQCPDDVSDTEAKHN